MKCGICDSTSLIFLFKAKDHDNLSSKHYSLYECKKCHTVSIQPVPLKKELAKYYSNSYYAYKYYGLMNKYFLRLRANKVPKKTSILDVGCGEGSFLELMKRRGYECCGLETSKDGAKKAMLKGLIVYNDIKKIRKKFDVITLWHVLEHITNPVPYLRQIRNLLNEEGHLIVAVPNFDSVQSKLGRAMWFHLAPPLHVFHYTPKTIESLLKKGNFRVIKIKHFSLEYNIFGYLQTFLNLFRTKDANVLYKLLRRDSYKINASFITLLALPIFVPISIIMSIVEAMLKKGGTILLYAKKD